RVADRHRARNAGAAGPDGHLYTHSRAIRRDAPGRLSRGRTVMTIDQIACEAEHWTERLLGEGYCVIPDLVPETIAALDRDLAEHFEATPFGQGGFYGARTKRFGRL